ncbi:thiosulfohydrolase SoxB [Microbulbifer pacificus]|uniref:Thiosulfohydrolase SoxB n=1 Tax=Microbulbifer pacificus TaxID=407164 RepID=A0AAU0MYA7_9GAMM|nr:thiosulfohydrolase SoxB [Microbulbifer pacificus]WOX04746.1 thiosulfohydrolase SoxB [Microbulbifer pacificus]
MNRREFAQMLGLGVVAGISLPLLNGCGRKSAAAAGDFYNLPRFGNVHFMHMTDAHAQLMPIYYREPSVNIGVHGARNQSPHIVGEAFLQAYGLPADSRIAHALTYLDFNEAAAQYGRVGGFAHLATLVKQVRASRPGSLLLDGGDLWQGSATSLWTKGQDMVDASKALGIDIMTGHWEFTLGADRVMEIIENDLDGHIEFLAHNVKDFDFGDAIFASHTMREMNGVPVAIIGQAFPYTPIANPGHFTPGWTFGIQERELQETINKVRSQGAQVVVLLSHNGADVDIKLASRLSGLDAIMGGHTHDAIPQAIQVKNSAGGQTLVTNAGSNGKFLGVLDFDVQAGKIKQWHYRLLPVFANLLPADPEMTALIDRVRAPYLDKLNTTLATTEGLLYRRGNFNGSFDQLIVDALMETKDAEIAFSPGFRWGTSLLPGDTITVEDLMSQVAITYPQTTVNEFTGERIKFILEDVADNLFNPDPYYQQGGDMVRVGGLDYTINPNADSGNRISGMSLNGNPVEAGKTYKVAGWAPVAEGVEGEPIWDVVGNWLASKKTVPLLEPKQPRIVGLKDNLGLV